MADVGGLLIIERAPKYAAHFVAEFFWLACEVAIPIAAEIDDRGDLVGLLGGRHADDAQRSGHPGAVTPGGRRSTHLE
jgi:hypothetical protein